jgi:hypothetical protein
LLTFEDFLDVPLPGLGLKSSPAILFEIWETLARR